VRAFSLTSNRFSRNAASRGFMTSYPQVPLSTVPASLWSRWLAHRASRKRCANTHTLAHRPMLSGDPVTAGLNALA
jgi:hypothetical protein